MENKNTRFIECTIGSSTHSTLISLNAILCIDTSNNNRVILNKESRLELEASGIFNLSKGQKLTLYLAHAEELKPLTLQTHSL